MQFQRVALTPPKVKFSIKDFFSKCIQIRKFTGKRIFCSLFYQLSGILKIGSSVTGVNLMEISREAF